MPAIQIESLTKSFGLVHALNGVDLWIDDASFVTLLGPSGCGKTTMLRLLAGFARPDSGTIAIDGKVVASGSVYVPPERRNIGMVFQNFALWPHLSVWENVLFGLRARRIPRAEAERRARRALEAVRIADLAERYPWQLSGGQQQRVAVGRAIATESRILLFDEPLSNLDAQLRDEMRIEIRDLHVRLNLTSVFVTHDQTEAMVLSDLVCVMDQGRILQLGAPRDVYERPASARVATFVGSTNLIPARVVSRRGRAAIVSTAGGQTLVVEDAGGLADGAPARLCIRPEQIALYPAAAPADGRLNVVPGRLVKRLYGGASYDCQVEALGQRLRVLVSGEAECRPGEVISVWLDPRKLFAVADERES